MDDLSEQLEQGKQEIIEREQELLVAAAELEKEKEKFKRQEEEHKQYSMQLEAAHAATAAKLQQDLAEQVSLV